MQRSVTFQADCFIFFPCPTFILLLFFQNDTLSLGQDFKEIGQI